MKAKTSRAAQQAAVSDRTIRRWAKRGWIPHERTIGGHLRVDLKQMDRAMEKYKASK